MINGFNSSLNKKTHSFFLFAEFAVFEEIEIAKDINAPLVLAPGSNLTSLQRSAQIDGQPPTLNLMSLDTNTFDSWNNETNTLKVQVLSSPFVSKIKYEELSASLFFFYTL